MSKKELIKKYVLLVISLFFSALGVAFAKHGELGVSPISSVANVMSYRFDGFTLGTWLIIWNCVLIAGQTIILRKNFKPIEFLQIPVSFLFEYFTDIGMWCVSIFNVDTYFSKLVMVIIGVVILGFGISLSVIANVVMNSGEAFVKAISDTFSKNFGNMKIVFDIGCVLTSVILSLVFFNGSIMGTREGTLIAALCTGIVVKFFLKHISVPIGKLLQDKQNKAVQTTTRI